MLNNQMKSDILKLVDQLASLEKERNELRQKSLAAQDKLSLIRAKKLIEITFARDDKDRALYSNESVREAALVLFLDKEPEYHTLRDELRRLEARQAEIAIEHQRLYDYKALLMFEAGLTREPLREGGMLMEV